MPRKEKCKQEKITKFNAEIFFFFTLKKILKYISKRKSKWIIFWNKKTKYKNVLKGGKNITIKKQENTLK